jgi:V8-like Glu-specific endopeptidase
MMTKRSPKTPRRAARAAATGIAALLVTALVGLAEPATAATPATTMTTPPTAAWQTSKAHGGPDSHDDDDKKDDKKKKKEDEEKDRREQESREHESGEDESREDEPEQVLPTVGQVLSESKLCSGTVIESGSRQLVLTAAHCVYTPERSTPAGGVELGFGTPSGGVRLDFGDSEPGPINEELTFAPGLNGDEEPHGRWKVEGEPIVADEWKENGDPRFDFAVLRIAKRNNKAIQDVVGGQRVATRVGEQSELSLFGYPGERRFDGTTQESCSDNGGDITLDDNLYGMACDLGGGTSGGAWLANLDKRGFGEIVAVTSAKGRDGRSLIGASLSRDARALIDAADDAGEDKNDNDNNSNNENSDNNSNGDNSSSGRYRDVDVEEFEI